MTPVEIELKDRTVVAEILEQDGHYITASIDGTIYRIDLEKMEAGIYSLLFEGKSYEMEINRNKIKNNYSVQSNGNQWNIQIVDAEVRYQRNHQKGKLESKTNYISSPMPGKVVKILVKPGQQVRAGDTLIIISAMKMESEYKAPKDAKIKKINVREGDNIEGNEVLITLE
jgi:biotin carboxyl carrier protein